METIDIKNKKWTDDEFYKVRKEVLATWPTGSEVDLDEAIAYHKSLPEHKVFSNKLNKAKKEGVTLIQPRAGVGLIEKSPSSCSSTCRMPARRTCCRPPSTPIPVRTSMKTALKVSAAKKRAWPTATSTHTSTASRQLTTAYTAAVR